MWMTSYHTEYILEDRTPVRTRYLAWQYQTRFASNICLSQDTHFHPVAASCTPSKHRTTSSCDFMFFAHLTQYEPVLFVLYL